jgi:hypothetical protein
MSDTPTVLDPCCGSRMMWFDKEDPRVVFGDRRSETITVTDRSHGNASGTRTIQIEPDTLMDFRALPFPDGAFKLVAFDPPHLVKAGPKSWLARPSARVTRTYDVRALLVEAPYFVPPQPGADPGKLPPEIADIAETPLERWARRQGYAIRSAEGIRKPPELVAAELIDFIVAGVEPEAWRASDAQYERRRARGDAAERDPLSVAGQWASVSYHDGALLVVAPDYVHRAIAGLRR